VIGKVWADLNANGVQDAGEPGVEGVDVWTVNGEVVTTDPEGRFSLHNMAPGRQTYRLDAATLPLAYGVADEPMADLEQRDATGWTTPRVVFRVLPRAARLEEVRLPLPWTLIARPTLVQRDTLDAGGCALYFSRAQIPFPRGAGGVWYRHAGIYAYRAGFLARFSSLQPSPLEQVEALEQLRALWHGFRIAVTLSEAAMPPGVDTPQDLEAVRRMIA